MAKKKVDRVTEDFTWQVSVTLAANSQSELEAAVEQIESKLDDVADDVEVETDGLTVTMI